MILFIICQLSYPCTEPLKHYSAQVSQPVSILFVIVGICGMGTRVDSFFPEELGTNNSISRLVLSNNSLYNYLNNYSFSYDTFLLLHYSLEHLVFSI